MKSNDNYGVTSPGGFVFGVQGWHWGEPRPTSITFFIDGTAKVADQHGRPIRGSVIDGRTEVLFAHGPPSENEAPEVRSKLASHALVIKALAAERIDWQTIPFAGWPQLPYEDLVKVNNLPLTPIEQLRKITDKKLRMDAIKMRTEMEDRLVANMVKEDE